MLIREGAVTLFVIGAVSLSGQSFIYIAPGASLRLFCGGPSLVSSSSQGIINSGRATNCIIYGLAGCSTVNYRANQPLVAFVYAPQAALSVTGALTGALVGASANLNANGAACHYDEAILRLGLLPEPMPWLGPIATTPGGQVQFAVNGNGRGGFPLIVEASTNLIDWVALETNTVPFVCGDPSASNFPLRFYRSVSAP
jgi:hypothetical protein